MKDLSPLEKEFLENEKKARKTWFDSGYTIDDWIAKAATALCSEKIRRAIELAREELEAKLKPKFMNDVFTWKQIKDAFK